MRRRARWSLVSMLAVASLTGQEACQSGGQCLRHTDCTRQEFCDFGTCVIKPSPGSGLGDAGAGASDAQATGGRLTATGGQTATGGRGVGGAEAGSGGAAGNAGDAGAGG